MNRVLVSSDGAIRRYVQNHYQLAESPYWSFYYGGLFWVDILEGKLCFSGPGENPREWEFDGKITSCAGAEGGQLVISLAKQIVLFDPRTSTTQWICDVEPDRPQNRCNDGAVDPYGNFWFGTMDDSEGRFTGSLYCLPYGNDEPLELMSGIGISNTLAWDLGLGRMYFADSAKREVYALEVVWGDGTPHIGGREVYLRTPEGVAPDGSCVDREGRLYTACWGGSKVSVSNRCGICIGTLELPARYVTSCCFGGSHGDTLFVTSAAPPGLSDPGKYGGCIFAIEYGEDRGTDEALFALC